MRATGPSSLRTSARILGVIAFLMVELFLAVATWLLFSIRCCDAGGGAGPRSAADWADVILFGIMALALGAALGWGVARAAECALRLADRLRRKD